MRVLRLFVLVWAITTPALAQELSAEAEFRTLWWSKEQMRNFDPNRPPPKATELVIDHWEYSDPVGVPHPDEITAQIAIRNKGSEPSPAFRLCVEVRWKEGPESNSKRVRWSTPRTLKTADIAAVPGNGEKLFSIPIDLEARMAALEGKNWWPHEMELIVSGSASGSPLFRYRRSFPILRGD